MRTQPSPTAGPGVRRTVTPLHPVAPVAAVQGTLALELDRETGPAPIGVHPGSDLVEVDPLLRRRLEQWAGRFCQVACDVSVGARPASQLLRWSSPDVYADLTERARAIGTRRRDQVRPRVAAVRPSFLSATSVEVAVRVAEGARYRAVAAHFEEHRGHWRCTALVWG